eukprot:TRINITY_DN64563_c0_g1_i1.p1 TRINITY_DN64563_c0_g1~~TRINITY_DN64563_c0_g1_i1.p1  ORF type:complete len:760 (-),score=187.12 TRINITY_DN64563_c0_g1_i1:61-2340(-)
MAGAAAAPEDEPAKVYILEAALWGFVSAVSLQFGSLIGVTYLPRPKIRAMLMSFGGGALLFALSIELFGHSLHGFDQKLAGGQSYGDASAGVWIMDASAVVGGLFFAGLNRFLNSRGAHVRHAATAKTRIKKLRSDCFKRVCAGFLRLPVLSNLPIEDMVEIVQKAMYRERYGADDVILSRELAQGSVYFILAGQVEVEVYDERPIVKPDGRGRSKSSLSPGRRISKTASLNLASFEELSPLVTFSDGGRDSHRTSVSKSPPRRPSSKNAPSCLPRLQNVVASWELGVNQVFGDIAILTGCKLATKVTATRDTKVLVLPDQELQQLIEDCPVVREHFVARAIERLQKIPHVKLDKAAISKGCAVTIYEPEDIIFEGCVDEATAVQFVISGSAEVTNDRSGASEEKNVNGLMCAEYIERLRPSESITIRALEQTMLLVLERNLIDVVPSLTLHLQQSITPSTGETEDIPHVVLPMMDLDLDKSVRDEALRASARSLGWENSDRERERRTSILQEIDGRLASRDEDIDASIIAHLMTDEDVREHDFEMRSQGRGKLDDGPTDDLVRNISGELFDGSARFAEEDEDEDDCSTNKFTSEAGDAEAGSSHAAIMVWLGILIDAVPESLIIGVIVNKSAAHGNTAKEVLPFVIGVFLSNLPESMGSAGSMKAHGMRVSTILLLWLAITAQTAVGAALGALLFPANSASVATELAIAAVEGIAAGAMLTMIAQTMMPEAFEQGGDVVGLLCLAGFICASLVKLIPL